MTRFEFGPRSMLWALLGVFTGWLAIKLWTVFIVIIVALIIAGTINPLLRNLERRGLGRVLALSAIFLGMLAMLASLLFLTLPSLISQLMKMMEHAPAQRERLIAWLDQYAISAPLIKSIKAAPLDELTGAAGTRLLAYSSQIIGFIGYAVTTVFLSIYLLADATRVTGALYAVVPRHYHLRLARVLLNLEIIVGGYMRGQLITSLAIGVFTFVLLTVLGVPDPLALAVFAALTDVIPMIGGLLASAPAIIAGFAVGPMAAIIIAIGMFVYQEFESRLLVPRLYGRVLRLSPVVVLVALLIGGVLLGILGALLALPVAAALQMVVRELRFDLPGDDRDVSDVRLIDEKAELVYEQMSAGAPAEVAAAIAGQLAHTRHDFEVEVDSAGGTLDPEAVVAVMDGVVVAVEVDPSTSNVSS